MKKNLINTLNIENKELWCLEKTLRHDRHFGNKDNIPWAIFTSLALTKYYPFRLMGYFLAM